MNILNDKVLIAIPSRARSRKVWTKHNLMLIKHFEARFFVWEDDAENYFNSAKNHGFPSCVLGIKNVTIKGHTVPPNIGQKREAIMEYAVNNNYTKVVMIDDLCSLLYRKRHGSSVTCTKSEQFQDMLEQMVSLCTENSPLIALMSEFFIQSNRELFGGPRKLANQYICIDTKSYKKGTYSQVTTHEDVALHSYFLSVGKLPILLGTYTRSKPSKPIGGVWSEGVEKQLEERIQETKKLERVYPGIFTPTYRKPETGKSTSVRFLTKEKRPCSKDLMKLMRANGYEGSFLWKE